MKNAVFWDVSPCRSTVNRRIGATTYYTRYTRRNIPEDGIFHSHLRENIKSIINTYSWRRPEKWFGGVEAYIRTLH
jgi:hypothetical protein